MTAWNPFQRIRDWLAWRRRDRDEVFVASWTATTAWQRGDALTGVKEMHIVSFYVDGNSLRWSDVETTHQPAADNHDGVLRARHDWREFGQLPSNAKRATPPTPGRLRVIPGGRDNGGTAA